MQKRWGIAAVVAIMLAAGLFWFEPWTLWTRSSLDEDLPEATPAATSTATAAEPSQSPTPTGPIDLAAGDFVTQEHETSGSARIVELADGSRVLRVENFSTSNGPDLEVWLTDQSAGGDWFKYDDGEYVNLGKLKATDGNHNYEIPADIDVSQFSSAVIWCVRFNVSFGSAPLEAV